MQVCKEQLSNGKSVVVDNTNPKVEARKPFIQLAQKQGKPRQVIPCHTHHINRAWNVISARSIETENFQSWWILPRLHEMKKIERWFWLFLFLQEFHVDVLLWILHLNLPSIWITSVKIRPMEKWGEFLKWATMSTRKDTVSPRRGRASVK